MESLISAAAANWFWSVIGLVAIVWVVVGTVASVITSWTRERSRREIAAYVASGSMTPEQGERLLKAGGETT